MATQLTDITEEQRQGFLAQLAEAQRQIDVIKQQQSGGTTAPNPAFEFGAAGRGEGLTPEISAQVEAATAAGVPMSELGTVDPTTGKSYMEDPSAFKPPTLSGAQSARYVSSFGLEGILDPGSFSGLTAEEANRRGIEETAKRKGQVSSQTSFAFNPETISRTQRAIDKFGFSLDESSNDPFDHKDVKIDKQKSAIEATSKEIGQLFSSAEELYNAYQTNQQIRETLDGFIQKGGDLQSIASNVGTPVVSEAPQTTDEYLASITNPQANQEAQRKAVEELAPERDIAQQEIMRQASIPQQLQDLYFGNERQMGILEMRQEQALEEKRILEEREKDAARTTRDRAEMSIAKNNAESKRSKAEIEHNRLTAKNYMTTMLGKLGALKTTGAAPQALSNLEIKYQQQVQNVESAYRFANQAIEIGMEEDLNEIENKTDELILGIQEDLTLGSEKVAKEILKAQQSADRETYKVSEQYARRLRERTTKYTAELKKEAAAYAKKYASIASDGLELDKLAETIGEGGYAKGKGVLLPSGEFTKLRLTPSQQQQIESAGILGDNVMRYFITLPKAFRDEFSRESVSTGRSIHATDTVKKAFDKWTVEQEKDDDDDDDDEFKGF